MSQSHDVPQLLAQSFSFAVLVAVIYANVNRRWK